MADSVSVRLFGPLGDRTTNREVPGTTTEGLRAARAVAQWHLGDPGWANVLLAAHANPTEAMKKLSEEMGDG